MTFVNNLYIVETAMEILFYKISKTSYTKYSNAAQSWKLRKMGRLITE